MGYLSTYSGALRVISRPQPPHTILIHEAKALLQTLTDANQQHHHFWSDDISLLDETLFDLTKLQGYRQMTDLHLLGIAHRNGGTFVTLDNGFTSTLLAVRAPAANLLRLLTP
jgi:predicted nucleic acid-binding protein